LVFDLLEFGVLWEVFLEQWFGILIEPLSSLSELSFGSDYKDLIFNLHGFDMTAPWQRLDNLSDGQVFVGFIVISDMNLKI